MTAPLISPTAPPLLFSYRSLTHPNSPPQTSPTSFPSLTLNHFPSTRPALNSTFNSHPFPTSPYYTPRTTATLTSPTASSRTSPPTYPLLTLLCHSLHPLLSLPTLPLLLQPALSDEQSTKAIRVSAWYYEILERIIIGE